MSELEIDILKSLLRHIDGVRANCLKLGDKLMALGEESLGLNLIANGYEHDNSKFHGIEWMYLNEKTKETHQELFNAALVQHTTTNKHHPEAWTGGIHEMDRLFRAEMVCDWSARSSEMGTDLRDYLKNAATKRYGMTVQSKAYKDTKDLMDMLLDTPFKKPTKATVTTNSEK